MGERQKRDSVGSVDFDFKYEYDMLSAQYFSIISTHGFVDL